MVAVTAFRTFFVTNAKSPRKSNRKAGLSPRLNSTKQFLLRLVTPRTWVGSKPTEKKSSSNKDGEKVVAVLEELPAVPGGNITGLRSLILA